MHFTNSQILLMLLTAMCGILFLNLDIFATITDFITKVASAMQNPFIVSTSQLPSANLRYRNHLDDVGFMTISADPAGPVLVQSIKLTLTGLAVKDGSTPFSVQLKTLSGSTAQTCTPGAGNICDVTFTSNLVMAPGTSKKLTIRIDSSAFYDEPRREEDLTVYIAAASDVAWGDLTTDNIPLEAPSAPLVLTHAVY